MHGAVPQRGVMLRECKGLVQGLVAQDFDGEVSGVGSTTVRLAINAEIPQTALCRDWHPRGLARVACACDLARLATSNVAGPSSPKPEPSAAKASPMLRPVRRFTGSPWSRHFRQSTMLHFLPSLRDPRTQPSSGAALPVLATGVRADPIELVRPNAPRNCRPSNRASPRACLEFFRTGAWAALEYTELRGARSPAVQNKPAPGYRSAGLNGPRATRSKMVVFNVSTPRIHSRPAPFILLFET